MPELPCRNTTTYSGPSGKEREGIRQFQASVEVIQHRVSQLSPDQTREEIQTLQQAINRAHAELETIDHRVDEIALAQLYKIEVDEVPMRAQPTLVLSLFLAGSKPNTLIPQFANAAQSLNSYTGNLNAAMLERSRAGNAISCSYCW
ncbi:hypothetical protein [Nitrosospira sp. NRS527]|uniref:hypothetical protein n=1 Tax=Nitrosospira sp. NRS527 TaxID=155925 RepID=UPI001BCD5618|nr:hypothetical protein [Nitrosospira sp. NRS527]